MYIGRNLKKIRKNKGYTQAYMARRILSQGSYSKFEDEKSDVKAETLLKLLKKIHMSSNEFIFIANEYEYPVEQQLMLEFFNLPYNDLHQLNLLKGKLIAYLKNQNDNMLSDVLTICNALIKLSLTNDIEAARNIVIPVWDRLANHNNWYVKDIQLINVLLYLFPVDMAIEVTKNLLNRLNLYIDYQETSNLHFTLRINLTLLLIKNERYQEALNILEYTLIKYQRKMPFQSLALCFSRKSLCLLHLGNDSSEKYLQKAKQLLEIYEDNNLWRIIEKEYLTYSNKPKYVY